MSSGTVRFATVTKPIFLLFLAPNFKPLIQYVLIVFKCCGCNGPTDYKNLTAEESCRRDNNATIPVYYDNGCYQTIIDYLDNHLPYIMSFSIAMILFQMFCLIVSVRVCTAIQFDGYEDI